MSYSNSLDCNKDQLQCFSVSSDPPSSPLRRTTNYQPSKCDGRQIQLLTATEELMHAHQREKLKEDVRNLINKEKSPADRLKLIDSLKQFGVAYHFDGEIKHVLSNLMNSSVEELGMEFTYDVYVIALFFRLSREYGFEISQDVLIKCCKDDNGCFMPSLSQDIRGMLSLYEASFFAMEGEDELDEAKEFAIKHLSKLMSCSSTNPTVAKHIARALGLPLHMMIPRLQAWLFMETKGSGEEIMEPKLLELAELDFNMTQNIYKRELKEMMSWWADLGIVGEKLKFARDWLVESYFLAVGLAFEPHFRRYRIEFTKAISIINVLDDIYDIYGSLEELQLFTHAVERWEVSAIKTLPEYMKICLTALMSTVNGLAQTIKEEKGLDIRPHLKRGWLDLCEAYMMEARWYHRRHIPKFEEYKENAWVSVAAPLMSVIAHCLSDNLTNSSLKRFEFYPSIIQHSSMIFRLYNDLGTSKGELTRGDVAKSIQCFMNETDASEAVACNHIKNLANKCWKKLNKEWMMGSIYEDSFRKVAMNLPRVAHVMYLQGNEGNGELNLEMVKKKVITLLLQPINLKESYA